MPIVLLVRVRSDRAERFTLYLYFLMFSRMRLRVSSPTEPLPLMTFETLAVEQFETSAINLMDVWGFLLTLRNVRFLDGFIENHPQFVNKKRRCAALAQQYVCQDIKQSECNSLTIYSTKFEYLQLFAIKLDNIVKR